MRNHPRKQQYESCERGGEVLFSHEDPISEKYRH